MTGHYAHLIAQRERILSTARMSPAARARALGQRYTYVEATIAATDKESCGGGESRPACERPVGENHSTVRALPKVENREVPSGTTGSANGDGCRAGAGVAPGPQDVIEAVAEAYGVSIRDLISGSRRQNNCRAKWAAALLMRYRLKTAYGDIGAALGWNAHHIGSALRRAREHLGVDEDWTWCYRAADRMIGR